MGFDLPVKQVQDRGAYISQHIPETSKCVIRGDASGRLHNELDNRAC